jgi:hypothetical protein
MSAFRNFSNDKVPKHQWIVLTVTSTPSGLESMNTVLLLLCCYACSCFDIDAE